MNLGVPILFGMTIAVLTLMRYRVSGLREWEMGNGEQGMEHGILVYLTSPIIALTSFPCLIYSRSESKSLASANLWMSFCCSDITPNLRRRKQ